MITPMLNPSSMQPGRSRGVGIQAMLRQSLRVLGIVGVCLLGITIDAIPIANAADAGRSGPNKPYGLIEIGAKGVKAFTFDLDRAELDPACSEQEDGFIKCLDVQILKPLNVNAIDPAQKAKVAEAVRTMHDKMLADYHVTEDRLYLVGSSSVSVLEKKQELVEAVTEAVPLQHPIEFVTREQEGSYGYEGILGTLPYQSRKVRDGQALVIDVGSGGMQVSYAIGRASERKLVAVGMEFGTKRASDEIAERRGSTEFSIAAEKWRVSTFVPELRRQIENYPGLGSRNRVYLIGGISWALATMTYPDNHFVRTQIEPKAIDKFLATASLPDGSSRLCSDGRKEQYAKIAEICDKVFTINDLIAGGEILKGLSDELGFVRNNKHLFFFDALYVWDLGYMRHKLNLRNGE
jgi:Ppx/GppA phosphatase family